MIELPSGKVLDIATGIVGINETLETFEGYDQRLFIPTPRWDVDDAEPVLDERDARDLAGIMIARWTAFKEKHS